MLLSTVDEKGRAYSSEGLAKRREGGRKGRKVGRTMGEAAAVRVRGRAMRAERESMFVCCVKW